MLALVTGGTSGIGKAYAEHLASHAYNLLIVSRDEVKLNECICSLKQRYPAQDINYYVADLCDQQCVDRLILYLNEKNITIDFLVNNAGYVIVRDFTSYTINEITSMISLYNITYVKLVHYVLLGMLQINRGCIVNVSSDVSEYPILHNSIYCASKAFISMFSTALALDMADTPIIIQNLVLGPIDTEFCIKNGIQRPSIKNIKMNMANNIVAYSYRNLDKYKPKCIPQLRTKLRLFWIKHIDFKSLLKLADRL